MRRGWQNHRERTRVVRSRRMPIERLERRDLLAAFDLLVFTKTTGFRHSSIDRGVQVVEQLGIDNDFTVTATENASDFSNQNLANYEAVMFLNTTGDVLNASQQQAFEQYIQAGGGYVGVHSAADTEYNWPWYGELVGAYFDNHPAIQRASVIVNDRTHPSTAHLPEVWSRTDEWYNFRANPRGNVHVLATVDESTYHAGNGMGFDHPIAWTHDFDGGRAFYTGMGHSAGTFAEPRYQQHLLGGILYAAGAVAADAGATLESNFEVEVLDNELLDPMELDIAPDGRVIFIERAGKVKVFDPATDSTTTAGELDVYTEQEDGLLGLTLDPNFASNGWIYLFYSPAGEEAKQHISRFELNGSQLDLNSERILLEIPTQRRSCCHSAGSLAFAPDGTLYIATGDDTIPFNSDGYTPIDEAPFKQRWDAQRSAGNADDLRGKVLRIQPQTDGTYTIPNGNLFPADGSAGRPEIFVMGTRNPFRISIDSETGWLYWGDVGPDAVEDSELRGPRGHDEVNQARAPGNFGWPYFAADNQAYRDYDFATGESGEFFDPAAPVNDSPNNTGPQNLPPAQPAMIWYAGIESDEFPETDGRGGRTAMAGPVYRFDAALNASQKLPQYYDNTLFIYEWSRNWIREVKLDAEGNLLKINPFLPSLDVKRPMDLELGPDGALYLLEWGSRFQGGNADSRLSRIGYLANEVPPEPTPGDFDGDGLVAESDIGLLCMQIRSAENLPEFDLSGDSQVDDQDLSFLIHDVLQTTFGDANLDRVFDSADLIQIFTSGEYEDGIPENSTWSTGDWTCDFDFTSTDLVAAFRDGGYVQAARPRLNPGPVAAALVGWGSPDVHDAVPEQAAEPSSEREGQRAKRLELLTHDVQLSPRATRVSGNVDSLLAQTLGAVLDELGMQENDKQVVQGESLNGRDDNVVIHRG